MLDDKQQYEDIYLMKDMKQTRLEDLKKGYVRQYIKGFVTLILFIPIDFEWLGIIYLGAD